MAVISSILHLVCIAYIRSDWTGENALMFNELRSETRQLSRLLTVERRCAFDV